MGNFFVDMINLIISALGAVLSGILYILPSSPFTGIFNNSSISSYLAGLSWIIPFGLMISVLETWLTAITVYYIYQIVLRWIKVIG